MTTEYITRTKLIAGEGMILTNGTNYGTVIFLAQNESAYDYREITKSEYEAILDEQAKENMPDVVYGGASHTNI